MSRFTLPRDIYFGANAISELKNLQGHKKAIIVTGGSSMQKHGFLQKTETVLRQAGLETKIFEGVEPDPSIETVMRGAEMMQQYQPDVIVAIGGGSPIDAAKAMWVFYEHPEKSFDDIKEPFSIPKLRKKAIFVAIPSTSGTATEVTAFSVITDYTTKIKYPLADFEITPDIAVLDTDIPMTMPKALAAHTGMDAFTHAVEAYVASGRSAFSDPLALQAISDVYGNIVASYNGDADARCAVHMAQCLAGMAFSNALLGIVHSLAHKTGAEFKIPHGCCNAILLPFVIQYNSKICMDRFAQIARYIGLCGATDRQLTNSLVCEIRKLNGMLGIGATFRENGVTQEHFDAAIDKICENALLDPCTGSNPREIDFNNMKKLMECAFYGNDVTF